MAQFYENIKINGIDLQSRFSMYSVNVNQNNERVFGLDRSNETEENDGKYLFVNNKGNLSSFTLELCKIDYIGNVLPISDIELSELSRILFKDGITTLEHKGIMYYGSFINGKSWFNGSRQGYLTLEFSMLSDRAYSRIMNDSIRVIEAKTVDVYNKSTVGSSIFIDLDVELLNGTSFKITNLKTGKTFELLSLDEREKFYIYGKEREIVSKIDNSKNLFKLHSGDFKAMELVYGGNTLKIEGNCKVNIIRQDELCFI